MNFEDSFGGPEKKVVKNGDSYTSGSFTGKPKNGKPTKEENKKDNNSVNGTRSLGIDGVKNIDINAECDVIVRSCKEDDVKIKLSGKPDKDCKFNTEVNKDGTLKVEVRNPNKGTVINSINGSITTRGPLIISNGTVVIGDTVIKDGQKINSDNKVQCEVFIPEKYQINLDLNSQNGKIDLEGIICDTLKGETNSGCINLNTIKAANIDIATDTGSIDLTEVNCSDELIGVSCNGSIRGRNVSGNVKVKTNIGSIDIKNEEFLSTNKIRANTNIGEIKITLPRDAKVIARTETSMGNIKNHFEGNYGTPNVISTTNIGNIEIIRDKNNSITRHKQDKTIEEAVRPLNNTKGPEKKQVEKEVKTYTGEVFSIEYPKDWNIATKEEIEKYGAKELQRKKEEGLELIKQENLSIKVALALGLMNESYIYKMMDDKIESIAGTRENFKEQIAFSHNNNFHNEKVQVSVLDIKEVEGLAEYVLSQVNKLYRLQESNKGNEKVEFKIDDAEKITFRGNKAYTLGYESKDKIMDEDNICKSIITQVGDKIIIIDNIYNKTTSKETLKFQQKIIESLEFNQ